VRARTPHRSSRIPHISVIHEVGESSGMLYLSMEYVEGGDAGRPAETRPDEHQRHGRNRDSDRRRRRCAARQRDHAPRPQAVIDHSVSLNYITWPQWFDDIYNDPRYASILRGMRLKKYNH
jgi:hypothetical protein